VVLWWLLETDKATLHTALARFTKSKNQVLLCVAECGGWL
jgi:hypothetical protein